MTGEAALSVYPNPATGIIYIRHNAGKDAVATVFDLQGRAVMQQSLAGSDEMHIAQLPPGQYMLQLRAPSYSGHLRFIKQ